MSVLLLQPPVPAQRQAPSRLRVGDSVVVRRRDGTLVAVHRASRRRTVGCLAICPHCGEELVTQCGSLCCTADGSRFDTATGAVLHGPAAQPLARIAVRVCRGPWLPG